MGMTCPDPKGTYTTPDGVVIPMGKGSNSTCGHTSLLYNEYPFARCTLRIRASLFVLIIHVITLVLFCNNECWA